jgi:hypothetical protein
MTTKPGSRRWRPPPLITRRKMLCQSAVRASERRKTKVAARNRSENRRVESGARKQPARLRPDRCLFRSVRPRLCFGHTGSSRQPTGKTASRPSCVPRRFANRLLGAHLASRGTHVRKRKFQIRKQKKSRARFVRSLPDEATTPSASASGTPRGRNDAAPEQNFMRGLDYEASRRRRVEKG